MDGFPHVYVTLREHAVFSVRCYVFDTVTHRVRKYLNCFLNIFVEQRRPSLGMITKLRPTGASGLVL